MPYAGPAENKWATISLTFNNNNDNNNNNKRQPSFLINRNNINENTSSSFTSTLTTTTTTIFSTTITNNNSKTFPLSSPLQDYNNITTSSSYNASNIETTSRHKLSSSSQPEFLTASSRRKSAPEFLKPLLIPQKNFQREDDQLIIIKKKNGDIVKPSLKKKSKSEPNTPILPKYVHFNADLEQIRLFREAQEPQAVSADVTSDESDDDDDDFVFSDDDDDDGYYRNFIDQEPELTINLPNMPLITTLHSSKPVYVDSIFLSRDKNKLQGRIMVQNIAFHKLVEVRYTFDFWQTVSEVKATYAEGVADKDKDSFDVFIFSIELFDNSRNPIDGKTMYFAVHYNVSNRDYWDNNSGSNYRVNFKKVKKSSSSSQCNHHCHQNSKVNGNQGSLPKLSSTAIATNSSSSRKWPIIPSTPVNHLPKKSLSDDCHSPPNSTTHTSIADSRKKGVAGRYDIGVSLSAAQNIPRSLSSFNNNSNVNNTNISNKNINKINNNNSATTLSSSPISSFTNTRTNYYHQTPYFPTLAISCDAYKPFSSGGCYIDGMPVTTETATLSSSSSLQWEGSPKKSFGGFPLMSSNPIAIPTTKSSASSYYDHIVSQYCFSSGSPYATAALASSPYASSPPVM